MTHQLTYLSVMCYHAGLCNAASLEETLTGIEGQPLARIAGVTRASVQAT